ncbi:MAG: hypothetical protein KAF91_32310 [Nostoc sp. TH1S01]|nr:hypothetical protein [Nostoc sp. TH1S01]
MINFLVWILSDRFFQKCSMANLILLDCDRLLKVHNFGVFSGIYRRSKHPTK